MIWLAHTAFVRDCPFTELRLQNGTEYKNFDQNVLVYGSKGCGKKTYIEKWVEQHFDCGSWENRTHQLNTEKKCETRMYTRKSAVHTELVFNTYNLSLERYWVRHVVRFICQRLVISADGSLGSHHVILYNCHVLSPQSIALLRTYMGVYTHCVFILVGTQCSHLYGLLSGSITTIRFTHPSFEQLAAYIQWLCDLENVPFDSKSFRDAFDRHGGEMFSTIVETAMAIDGISNDYRKLIDQIVDNVSTNVFSLKKCRSHIYTLIVNNMTAKQIISDLCKGFLIKFRGSTVTQGKITSSAAYYEHLCVFCERPIYHYEAFICETASIIMSRNSNLACIS